MRKDNILYLILAFFIFTITLYLSSHEKTNLVGKAAELTTEPVLEETEPTFGLSDYPDIFIEGNSFNGVIVVGASATADDVIAAGDIIQSLESIQVSEVITGDVWKVETSTRKLEMSENMDIAGTVKENIANITSFVDDSDLNALAQGEVTTDMGTAKYSQYLYFENKIKSATSGSEYVMYMESDEDVITDFFYIRTGEQIARYLLEFKTAFKSGVEDGAGRSDTTGLYLGDYENEILTIMGQDYEIIKARRINAAAYPNSVELTLMRGAIRDTLEEGATKTYVIDGKEYIVKVAAITDVSPVVAKFQVNGEITSSLSEGSVHKLSDGTLIGVINIFPNEAGDVTLDMADFFLGASSLFLKDEDITDTKSSNDLVVSNELIKDAKVTITGSNDNIIFTIDSIYFNITADENYFVPAGKKLSSVMEKPQALLNFDIFYKGLTNVPTEKIKIKTSSSGQYELEFTDGSGYQASIPIAYTSGGTALKFGDDDDNLFVDENHNITRRDYFIISDYSQEAGQRPTYALRYMGADKSSDENPSMRFENPGDASIIEKIHINDSATNLRKATLRLGRASFNIYSQADADTKQDDFNIFVDLDGSGSITPNENHIFITTKAGAQIDLSNNTRTHIGVMITTPNTDDYENLVPNPLDFYINASAGELRLTENGSIKLLTPDTERTTKNGYTSLGAFVKYINPIDNPQELTIDYPVSQRTPNVYITSGPFRRYTGYIDVGGVKLDEEIQDIDAQNIISIGNACNNLITANIMLLSSEDCLTAFTEGYGLIKLFPQATGKTALVVAGYDGTDTKRAARVLANYEDFELEGTEECMAGTSLELEEIHLVDCPGKWCEDSDDGIDFYEKGECKQCASWDSGGVCEVTSDLCTSLKELAECYCDGTEIKTMTEKCPNGCEDGACIFIRGGECENGICEYVEEHPPNIIERALKEIENYTVETGCFDVSLRELLRDCALNPPIGSVYCDASSCDHIRKGISRLLESMGYFKYTVRARLPNGTTFLEINKIGKCAIETTSDGIKFLDSGIVLHMETCITSCPKDCTYGKIFEVKLEKGWNIISIPLVPSDGNITYIFSDIKDKVDSVYYYEPTELDEWKIWHPDSEVPSDLTVIEPGKGYWVKMKEKADLEILGSIGVGEPPVIPTFEVTAGWNLIGLYSLEEMPLSDAFANIENKYSSVWTYQGGSLKKLVISKNPSLVPGKGYWLYMREKGIIVP